MYALHYCLLFLERGEFSFFFSLAAVAFQCQRACIPSFSGGNCNSEAILIFSASAGSNTSCIWPNVMLSKFLCHQHESTWSLFSVSIAMAKRNHIGAEYLLKLLHLWSHELFLKCSKASEKNKIIVRKDQFKKGLHEIFWPNVYKWIQSWQENILDPCYKDIRTVKSWKLRTKRI